MSSARLSGVADRLLVVGEPGLNDDTRCAACGSLLFSIVRDGAYVNVAMGSLVDAPTIRPSGHIFVGSKPPCGRRPARADGRGPRAGGDARRCARLPRPYSAGRARPEDRAPLQRPPI